MPVDLIEHTGMIYAATAVIAAHVAATVTLAGRTTSGRILAAAGLLTAVAVVVLAFAIGGAAPLMGPLFAGVAAVTSFLLTPLRYAGHPVLLGEPYWRRVVLLLFHQRALDAR